MRLLTVRLVVSLSLSLSSSMIGLLWVIPASAVTPVTCARDLHKILPVDKRKLDEITELKVGTLNTLNLYMNIGKFETAPAPARGLIRKTERLSKDPQKVQELADFIVKRDLDFVVLEEVEDLDTLKDFIDGYLGDAYHFFWGGTNDQRGVQIAILAKRDLPFKYEFRSHIDETWVNTVLKDGEPTETGDVRPVFSRDLPLVLVRPEDSPKEKPMFALFGTHYKSKRLREGDTESSLLRTAQVQKTTGIVQKLQMEFKGLPVMLAGDFNGSLNYEPEYLSLWRSNHFVDSLDKMESDVPVKDRVTHTFHPREGARKTSQIDAVLVTEDMRDAITHAEVYRYTDANGNARPLPSSYEDREKNPSDHFPVYMKLAFPKLLGTYKSRDPASVSAPIESSILKFRNPLGKIQAK